MATNQENILLRIDGNVEGAKRALKDLSSAWSRLGRDLGQLKNFYAQSTAGAGTATQATQALGSATGATTGGIKGFIGLLGKYTPAAIAASLGLTQLIGKLKALSTFLLTVIDNVQTLQINLESLAARELVQAGVYENAADAMGTAELAAKGLLNQIQRIAIESPYEYQRVVETFRLAMAYGWTANQALSLTSSMLDLAAASGKTGWEMSRISVNLGQIRAKGKIVGQELRDLAGLGINLADILKSELNVSVDAFNAGLVSGKYTMSDFAKAIEGYVATNFAGSAKKLAATLQGLKASWQDLKEIALTTLFKGSLDQITAALADLFSIISDFVLNSGVLQRVGRELERWVRAVLDFLRFLASGVNAVRRVLTSGENVRAILADMATYARILYVLLMDIGQEIGKRLFPALFAANREFRNSFKNIRDLGDAFDGSQLVAGFRDTFYTVMQVVTGFLTSLRAVLRGDAPGAVAPLKDAFVNVLTLIALAWDRWAADAVTWGWNLIVQLANGMLKAADAVLSAVMRAIGTLIGKFIKPGSPPEKGPLSHIAAWGRGLMETFVSAFATADFAVLKEALAPVKAALEDAFSLGRLSKEGFAATFGRAREDVAALIAHFRQTGDISEDLLASIARTLGEGSEELITYLRLQLAYQRALQDLAGVQDEVARAEARGFVPASLKARLAAAQEQAGILKDQVAWQQEFLAVQRESISLQLRLVKAVEKLAGIQPKETAAGTAEPSIPETKVLTDLMDGLSSLDFSGLTNLKEALNGPTQAFEEMKEKVQAFLDLPLAGKLEVLAGKFADVTGIDFAGWLGTVRTFIAEKLNPKLEALKTLVGDKIKGATETLSLLWNTRFKHALSTVWAFIATYLFPLFLGFNTFLSTVFTLTVRGVIEKFETLRDTVKDEIVSAFTTLKTYWEEDFAQGVENLLMDIGDIIDKFNAFKGGFLTAIAGGFYGIGNAVWYMVGAVDNLIDRLSRLNIPDIITPGSPTPLETGFLGIARAAQSVNAEFKDLTRLAAARDLAAFNRSFAFNGGISVTVTGGMNFPGVHSARDALSIPSVLQRETRDAVLQGKLKGTL